MTIKFIKHKIRSILPDRAVYCYRIIQLLPKFLNVIIKQNKFSMPNICFYSDEQTVEKILNERCSLSRFGDGEFQWMTGKGTVAFQTSSKELSERLRESFLSDNDKLLIGIPKGIFDSTKNNLYSKMHWRIIRENYLSKMSTLVSNSRVYCDASITRPYIDYHSRLESGKRFENIKKIWEKKEIVIVEGSGTRLGIGSDLLSNALDIKRIICPSKNAFEKIDQIEQSICNNVSKDKMILVALGPTASILAYDMCKLGYQIIDIGHIDVEYIWYLRHDLYRKPIEGKSVNECGTLNYEEDYYCGSDYNNSIIDIIK